MKVLRLARLLLTISLLSLCAVPAGPQGERQAPRSARGVQEQADFVAELLELLDELGVQAAIDYYQELFELNPGNPTFGEGMLNSLGYRLMDAEKLDEAVLILAENVRRYPESWNALDSLGEAYFLLADYDRAKQQYLKSLELNPGSQSGKRMLERIAEIMAGNEDDYRLETIEAPRFKPGKDTGLQGPYLGQEPPGLEPRVFAPGIVSVRGGFEFSCCFTPDGKELYFNRGADVMVCRQELGGWTAPEPAAFNSEHLDHELHITADGRRAFFGSKRPHDGLAGDEAYGIFVMERSGSSWSTPTYLMPGMYVTTAANGNLYVTDVDQTENGIVRRLLLEGQYGEPVSLGGGVNSPTPGWHPCIAPDESWLVFDATREGGQGGEGDLYVCFREEDGSWGEAVNLGDTINTNGANMCASLSPDGKLLFYHARRDIWWVSTEAVTRLRPQ